MGEYKRVDCASPTTPAPSGHLFLTLAWRGCWAGDMFGFRHAAILHPLPDAPDVWGLWIGSFGSIISGICVYFNNFCVVPRDSREAVSDTVKGHPQTLPNLIFNSKSSVRSHFGKSVFSYFFTKIIFCSLSSCHSVEKQNKDDAMLNTENVFTRDPL